MLLGIRGHFRWVPFSLGLRGKSPGKGNARLGTEPQLWLLAYRDWGDLGCGVFFCSSGVWFQGFWAHGLSGLGFAMALGLNLTPLGVGCTVRAYSHLGFRVQGLGCLFRALVAIRGLRKAQR